MGKVICVVLILWVLGLVFCAGFSLGSKHGESISEKRFWPATERAIQILWDRGYRLVKVEPEKKGK